MIGKYSNKISMLKNIYTKPANWGLFFVAFSIILNTRQYLFNRSLWLDEVKNTFNIVGKSYYQLLDKLEYGQGIPAGFLFIEKFMIDTFYNNEYVLRLFPFISGALSIILFYLLVKKYLNSSSIILSVFLFSISDSLIYFSSEIKPYASDVFISVLLLLVVFYYDSGKSLAAFIVCAITGALAVWISYSSVFVLSGLGITLIISYLHKRNLNKLIQFIFICVIWSSSFLVLYHLSIKNQLTAQLVDEWSAGFNPFAPFPPLNASDLNWYFNAFFNVFTDPLSFKYKYIAGILYLLGCAAVFIRNKKMFFLLISPVVMTLIASGLERYPFSQRMLLFLIPIFYFFISEGILWVYKRSTLVSIVLTIIIAFNPLYTSIQYLVAPRTIEDIKPLLTDIRQSWKEGDMLYIDSWITELPFKYYKKQFGFKDSDYKVINQSFFYRLPEKESVWFLTSHSPVVQINGISRYFKMFGEEKFSRIAISNYYKATSHAAVFNYNFKKDLQQKEEGQFFLPGIGEWEGFYDDSWTNGNTLIKGLNYPLNGSYRFLILALNDYNPLHPDVEEIGLKVYINNENIPFAEKSGNKYIFILPPTLEKIGTIRVQSKTFVPKDLKINADNRELGVNINYIMLSNTEYLFYPWEMHNGIMPGIPNNIPVRFRWGRIRSSMDVQDFIVNNSKKELFLKCANPDIKENPVKVTLLIDDNVIKEILFDNDQWKSISLKTVDFEKKRTLTFQVSRTWSPKAFGMSGDARELGVALALPTAE